MNKVTTLYLPGTNSREAIAKRLELANSAFYYLETIAATYLDEFNDLKIPYSPLVPYQIWVLEQLSRIRRSDKKLSRKRIKQEVKVNAQKYSVCQYLKAIHKGA